MLLKLSKFFLYLSLFSVVIVLNTTFFPFIGGKYYFFRMAVSLALIFFGFWWGFEADRGEVLARFRKISRHPLFIAVSLFVLVYLLASIFALNPHAAFWSNFERGEGGFQMVHYYLFFLLLLLTFQAPKDWKKLFILSIIASSLVILYGVLANLGWVKNFINPYQNQFPATLWGRLTETRFQGSLGNPAYVAPYLMFAIFYALYLWVSRGVKSKSFFSALLIFLVGFFLFFFILTQTRGAFLGLVAASMVFVTYLLFAIPRARKWTLISFLSLVVAIGLLGSYRQTDFVKNLPGGRFFEIFDLGYKTQTVQTRLWTWGSAWAGFKERPVLGWGPENFSVVFDRHFDPRHFIPGTSSETWFDRAHSVFFDYLTETGTLGLLSYLSIFFIFYWQFFKKKSFSPSSRSESSTPKESPVLASFLNHPVLKGLVIALPIGYLVQGLVLFDVIPIYLNLFLFLSFALYQFTSSRTP